MLTIWTTSSVVLGRTYNLWDNGSVQSNNDTCNDSMRRGWVIRIFGGTVYRQYIWIRCNILCVCESGSQLLDSSFQFQCRSVLIYWGRSRSFNWLRLSEFKASYRCRFRSGSTFAFRISLQYSTLPYSTTAYTVAWRTTLTPRLPLNLSDQGEYCDIRSVLAFRDGNVLKRRHCNTADRGKEELVNTRCTRCAGGLNMKRMHQRDVRALRSEQGDPLMPSSRL